MGVDPSRTGLDGRHLTLDPIAGYVEFARRVEAIPLNQGHPCVGPFRTAFAKWLEYGHSRPDEAVRHHLSTLFPPVRPRGRYLEVRFLDVQPDEHVVPLASLLCRLLYDDDVRRQALRIVQYDDRRFVDHWALAALAPEALADTSSALLRLAGWTAPSLVGAA